MKRPRPSRSAFSLLEIMLVVAIIGMLMAVAAYNILGQSGKARIKTTTITMKTVRDMLIQYNLDNATYPGSLQVLVDGKILRELPKDAWGRPLYYNPTGNPAKPYDLISLGEDAAAGTADDLDIWTIDQKKE